jgi:hypothetical protein
MRMTKQGRLRQISGNITWTTDIGSSHFRWPIVLALIHKMLHDRVSKVGRFLSSKRRLTTRARRMLKAQVIVIEFIHLAKL